MTKKTGIFILIIILLLSMTGCVNQSPQEEKLPETVPEKAVEEDANEVEQADPKGSEAVETEPVEMETSYKIVSELTAYNTTTTMTTYCDGHNTRTEMDVPELSKSILIHLPDQKVMYQYLEGESTGVKMTDANLSYAEEMGLFLDTSLLAELTNQSSEDMTARQEMLDGEEVIYIEAHESDEEVGELLVKMWYSEKYKIPLKYQVYMGETLLTNLKVTEIKNDMHLTSALFMPPGNVHFEAYDMESLLEE